jgi:hypothetical protein
MPAGRLKARSFTLDGEAVVVGPNGLTDFEALRRRGSGDVAVLYAFDLLEYDGSDLRRMPLETRRATLASLLEQSDVIRFSEHIAAEGPDVFAHACRLGAVETSQIGLRLGPLPRVGESQESRCGGPAARARGEVESVRESRQLSAWRVYRGPWRRSPDAIYSRKERSAFATLGTEAPARTRSARP